MSAIFVVDIVKFNVLVKYNLDNGSIDVALISIFIIVSKVFILYDY